MEVGSNIRGYLTKKHITALTKKAHSYNQQDKKKGRLYYDPKYDRLNSPKLTVDDIIDLIQKYGLECYYCNDICDIIPKSKYSNDQLTLDRLDNNISHKKSNCVICCYQCNTVRSNYFTSQEFKKIKNRC